MQVVLPLFFEQDDYLVRRPELLDTLAEQAAHTGRAVLGALGLQPRLLVAHGPQQTALAHAVRQAEDLLLPITASEALRPHDSRLFPPGALAALSAASPEAEVSLVLNPRCPALEPQELTAACRAFRNSGADVLFSARPPEDHPCQGKRLFTRDPQRNPMNEGIAIQTTGSGTSLVLNAPCPSGSLLLIWQQSGRLILSPEPDPSGQSARFALPPECRILENATWGLLHPTPTPGPGTQMEPFATATTPWQFSHALNTVINTHTGRNIAGRQDFPETLIPDNNFCLIRKDSPARWQDLDTLTITAFMHDPALPALIKDEFSELTRAVLLDTMGH